ncbi:MAG TPA: proprotein convertase P-domain-containing protein [Gemmatales bacterium]|nr:proprotein convertase P-domain-containing protein [Gemmatales bacterium]
MTRPKTLRPQAKIHFEVLEDRCVPTATATYDYVLNPLSGATQYSSSGPVGLAPSQIRTAYGFNSISFGSVTGDGSGQTIAIVDAYDNPKFVSSTSNSFSTSDLHLFDAAFGIVDPPSFTKLNQNGGTSYPTGDTGWGGEIALDVEWTHALAPKANIVLVEANSASYSDLMAAVTYAKSISGVSVVSMSWGGSEFSGETSYDSVFTTPSGHQGVTFVASTGDNGQPGGYPAFSKNVVAVGGTRLTLGSGGTYSSESGWSYSGGGISTVESKPTYQSSVTQSSTKRTIPDVSFDADPNSGVAVYDSYANGNSSPWEQVGGTSFSAPAWAAIFAIANQGRVINGLGTLNGATQTLPMLYALAASDFHDVTTGSNGYSALTGYDLVTGRGSPYANLVARDLSGSTGGTITGDAYEPDNTQATAANLGSVSGTQTWSNLSIHTSTDVDWYQFTTVAAGTSANSVQIDFTNANGNLSLYLYNSSGTLLGSSTGTTNQEKISLSGLAAGSYYVKVTGVSGSTNSNYSLTTNAPVPTSTTTTYSATDLPLGIYDYTTTYSTITVPSDIAISKLTVQLNISHTYDSDLAIYLISPSGAVVTLANRRGGSGDNYSNTVFDSTATKAISAGAAPFSGTFKPETSLTNFNGKDAIGTWELVVQDRAYLDQGTLNSWSLNIQGTAGTGAGPARAATPAAAVGKTASSALASILASSAQQSSVASLLQSWQQSLSTTSSSDTGSTANCLQDTTAAAALAAAYQPGTIQAAAQLRTASIAGNLLEVLRNELTLLRTEV